MKLAILNWRDLANPGAGGAEVFVHEVAKRWVEQGHDVSQFSSRVKGLPTVDKRDGVEIHRVGWLASGTHHLNAPKRVKELGFDAVLESVSTIPYFLPNRKSFPPYVTLVHQMARDVWRHQLPGPLASTMERIEPLLLRSYRESHVLAVSESSKADLTDAGLGHVDVIPQGGIGLQDPIAKADVPTLLFVGRLASNKRPADAIAAFAKVRQRLPEARLVVVGKGPLERNLAGSLPAGAELLGHVSREDLLRLMGSSHLLLVTSVREGWGLVVTEANALGTPAVGYRVPGLTDSIQDGVTGALVDADPDQMARRVVSLLSDEHQLREMSSRASKWGGAFSWEVTADRLLHELRRSSSVVSGEQIGQASS